MLARCVAQILRLPQRPDALVFTGDLTDFGSPDEYANLRRLLAPLPMPSTSWPATTTSAARCARHSRTTPTCGSGSRSSST